MHTWLWLSSMQWDSTILTFTSQFSEQTCTLCAKNRKPYWHTICSGLKFEKPMKTPASTARTSVWQHFFSSTSLQLLWVNSKLSLFWDTCWCWLLLITNTDFHKNQNNNHDNDQHHNCNSNAYNHFLRLPDWRRLSTLIQHYQPVQHREQRRWQWQSPLCLRVKAEIYSYHGWRI